MLAWVSVDYYVRLERGTWPGHRRRCWTRSPGRCSSTRPSAHLFALARAASTTGVQRWRLHTPARVRPGIDAVPPDDLPEVTVADLAAGMDVAHSTATRLIDRAEAAGCVSRRRSATDTVCTVVAATPPGRALARTARTARTDYLAAVTADWTADQRRALAALLSRRALDVHTTPPTPMEELHECGPDRRDRAHRSARPGRTHEPRPPGDRAGP